MAKTLFEAYKGRMQIAEGVYSKTHQGEKLPQFKKVLVAKCLRNVNRFLNEAFDNSVGTQRADMGLYKKFCMNLTNVVIPNLIATDLVITYPMSSMSGYITYLQYVAGTTKGATTRGDVFNDPFRLGDAHVDYTSAKVVEEFTGTSGKASWFPVYTGEVVAAQARITSITTAGGVAVAVAADAKVTVAEDGQTLTFSNGTGTTINSTDKVKVAYVYDNTLIPQNDLPILNAQMKAMPLVAKARRIAIYYSQMAAFEAKTDYGFDLGAQLAEKAVGELSYEIDTEVTDLLIANAAEDSRLEFNKTLPVGVSKAEHYEGFSEIAAIGRQIIYDRTKRFAPNYMLVASDILPILGFIKGWSAAPASNINGPYFAGTLNGLRVYVTPNIAAGKFVLGVNGGDMMTSAAVYAPYMPVVPTQLLGQADGGMSQGWSTLYALEMLNKDLLVAGKVVTK